MLTLDKLQCRGTKTDGQITSFYCTGEDSGDITDNYELILDLPIYELGCKYLAIVLENTGQYNLDFVLKKKLPNSDIEDEETSGTVRGGQTPPDYAFLELTRPLHWKLYVKNSVAGQATKYKVTVLVVK